MANESKVEIGMSFNGDKSFTLSTKDRDYKQLLEIMVRDTKAWGADWNAETGIVTFRPAAGVGKVAHERDSE